MMAHGSSIQCIWCGHHKGTLRAMLLLAYLYWHKDTLPPVESGQSVGGTNHGPLIQPHSQDRSALFGNRAPSRGRNVLKALVHTHHREGAL